MKIAIPNKGRMCEPSIELLRSAGIKVDAGRKLLSKYRNIDVLFVRTQDIPEYVQDGVADLGITGLDLVMEKKAKVDVLLKLGYGKARLVIAAPRSSRIRYVRDIKPGSRIATEFPNITKEYFKKLKRKVDIVEVSGATEITPYLGVADVITDLTSTGSTLEMNNLRVIGEIAETEAVLIGNTRYKEGGIVTSLKSVIDAENKRYIMANVPTKSLEKAKKIIPGMESPTVIDLAEEGFFAVHSVVDEEDVFKVISRLKLIGCKDILVLPIQRLVK